MCAATKVVAWAVGVATLASAWGASPIGSVMADEGSKVVKSTRGGAVATAESYRFEVFFYTTGLRLFPRNSAGAPIDTSRLTGTATFYHPNSPEPWFARPLHPSAAGSGQGSESLDLVLGMSTVPPSGAKVTFEVAGLPVAAEPTARFTVPVKFVEATVQPRAARPTAAESHEYAPITREARYFPAAGYYDTTEGVVWVPTPGYYHVVAPTQYHPPGGYFPPAAWRLAHPAPSPSSRVATYSGADSRRIHTDYFWHSRAINSKADHDAWIRQQLRQLYGPGYRDTQ
jgi:hypothetical protein